MTNNTCWGSDSSWWILILFAIVLVWICCGNQGDACAAPVCRDDCCGCCR